MGHALVSVGLAVVLAAPQPEPDAPKPALPMAAGVEFTPHDDLTDPDWHRTWVAREVDQLLGNRPLASDQTIVIELAGATLDYRLTVTPVFRGAPLGGGAEAVACACTSTELQQRLREALARATNRLLRAAEAEVLAQERERASAERQAEAQAARERTRAQRAAEAQQQLDQQRERERERQRELSARPYWPEPLGIFGSVAISTGGPAALSGAVALGVTRGREPAVRSIAATSLATGLALLSAGLVSLAIDWRRCKRDRVACGRRWDRRRGGR